MTKKHPSGISAIKGENASNGTKRAIVTGVTGQDGYYMAQLLLKKGYEVFGIVRHSYDTSEATIGDPLVKVIFTPINLLNKSEVVALIEFVKPDEIYNFAAVSNVFEPWKNIDSTFDINIKIPQYLLEGIISRSPKTKFLQASSSLVFGRDEFGTQNENTKRDPIYPYGISKNMVDHLISEARLTYGIKACSAIFFNHESPRRGPNFFSKKIATSVANIKKGTLKFITVGNISSYRDYGYAPDYMKAAYLMLQEDEPKDYVVGTGELTMMSDYIRKCFEYVNLDQENYIFVDGALYRENDTRILRADITKIKNDLFWKPKTNIDGLVSIMMEDALAAH